MKITHWHIYLVTEILILRSSYPLRMRGFVSLCKANWSFWVLLISLSLSVPPIFLPHPAFHLPESLVQLIYMWKNLEHHVVRFQGNTESHSILISSLTVTIESIMFSMPSSWPPRRSQITFHLLCQSHSDHVHFSLLTHCHVTS